MQYEKKKRHSTQTQNQATFGDELGPLLQMRRLVVKQHVYRFPVEWMLMPDENDVPTCW